jgi:hypothetical protein
MVSGDRGVVANEKRAVPSTKSLSLLSLDGLALAAIFLQVSQLFRPFGYILGFATSLQVNLAFLSFFVFYVVVRNKTLTQLHSGVVAAWACSLLVVPALIMCLQLLDNSVTMNRLVYWTVFSLLFTLMLLIAVMLWARWGPNLSVPFFLACIVATWVGFVVNWLDYDFLREVMAFSSNPISASLRTVRTIGFYPHPNAAAFSIVLYFAILASTRKFLSSSIILQTLASMACFVGVLITGSRTSLLLLAVVFIWYIRNLFGSNRGVGFRSRTRALIPPLIPLAVMTTSFFALQFLASSRQDLAEMLNSRIGLMGDLLGGNSDTSVDQRVSMLSLYYSDLLRSPLLGRGPDFATNQIALGAYYNVSQNAWLEWGVAFGVPYAFLMALMLMVTYRLAARRVKPQPLLLSYARLILFIFAIITFSMVNIFWMPSTVCALGVLIGVLLQAGKNAELAPSQAIWNESLTATRHEKFHDVPPLQAAGIGVQLPVTRQLPPSPSMRNRQLQQSLPEQTP